ncbi:MAG: Flp pilus assembly protein CpaB [Chloroflexi bacterium]|nr:Flp pilus assembly protein CpaB [Chloroflexota bacterium]
MKRSNRLVLLIGVFLAALAFVFVIILLSGGSSGSGTAGQSAAPAEIETVVAARDIPLGVTVTAAMVATEKQPADARVPGAYAAVSQVIGQTARASIAKGQQLSTAQFVVGSGVNVECPAGFTCMSVQVDQVSGVGTLIKTGDYVDLIAQISPTFPINYFVGNATTPTTGALYDPTSVKMLLQGLQVVGTLLPAPPTTQTGAATPAPDSGGTTLNGQQEIVILAVTNQQAEVIRFAQVDGNITLALRSPKDFVDAQGNPIVPETTATTGLVLKTMVDNWGVLPPAPIVVPAPSPLP